MEQSKKPTYKCCIVPKCKSTTINTPEKVFFFVPRGVQVRKKWCKIMRRDMVSPSTCLYCCEDHFNLEEDTDNYIQYKIMTLQGKLKTTLRLKKGILPHKFDCQKATKPHPPPERKGFLKRRHLEIIEAALTVPPAKQSGCAPKINAPSQNIFLEPSTSSCSSQINTEETVIKNISEAACSTSLPNDNITDIKHVDKTTQYNYKKSYRSKGINVNLRSKKCSIISIFYEYQNNFYISFKNSSDIWH